MQNSEYKQIQSQVAQIHFSGEDGFEAVQQTQLNQEQKGTPQRSGD